MRVHCKKCERAFNSISSLRKHQWDLHRESCLGVRSTTRAMTVRQAKALAKLDEVPSNGRPPLLASEVLAELQRQQKFIGDMAGVIAGLIAQHEGNR